MTKFRFRLLLTILCFWIWKSDARTRPVFRDEDCLDPHPLGMESGRIPDESIWASSSARKRPPSEARLGLPTGAWTAGTPNGEQYLAVDLGSRHIITSVATQGRQGSEEYVSEFLIETSDDDSTWRVYTNELGINEVFDGNTNGHVIKRNTLHFPIMARYLRIHPRRWGSLMSLRLEIYGCKIELNVASFTGKEHITYDITNLPNPIHTVNDEMRLRFKTNQPNGILFYADGNQGDYFVLELKRGYLYFHIDLGSTQMSRGATSVIGGSLLDDNQWHDVLIERDHKKVTLTVDRLETKHETNGDFFRLDLDSKLFLGGVPTFTKPGISVRYNFFGCLENVIFNNVRVIRDARARLPRFSLVGPVSYTCPLKKVSPLSFPTSGSYLLVYGPSGGGAGGSIRVSLDFRTHNEDGVLFYHELSTSGFVKLKLDIDGHIWYRVESETGQIVEDIVRNNDVESPNTKFTDGLWHSLKLVVDKTKVNCTVDRNSKVSSRTLKITAGVKYYIGGSKTELGFVGCMQHLEVANQLVDLSSIGSSNIIGVKNGTCSIRDRCTPNPCEHGGYCNQNWNTFFCDCQNTGYKGEACHISNNFLSCDAYKLYNQNSKIEFIKIDVDGSGPLAPFPVVCSVDSQGVVETHVSHNSLDVITVNGYQEPGSYMRHIVYDAPEAELTNMIERSSHCRQFIEYSCNNSRLLAKPNVGTNAQAYGWWVGRTYQNMYYWGGAAPGSHKCKCGLEESGCGGTSTTCYCDSSLDKQISDSGYLEHKEYLPVFELHFGDTGSVTDNKVGHHRLGKLICKGDNLFDNVITFRKPDAVIKLPTFEAKSSGDIWFQFKTTARDGVLIHNVGSHDFIQVRLSNGDTIEFKFNVGDGTKVLKSKNSHGLNDNKWHTVHVERNRKQAWLKVDMDNEEKENEPQEQGTRTLDLSSPLVVGAAVGYQDGYVGCMRGLIVNGKLMDLRGIVVRGEVTYGVSEGCIGKCMSSPCYNGGTCREGYSGYTCDCSYTPFRGWMCGREVGANLLPNYMITYKFSDQHGISATDFQYARIGYSTKRKQGILMQIRNKDNSEYISVEMNNQGGVKMVIDVGFGREEVNSGKGSSNPIIDTTNGQQHEIVIQRTQRGRYMKVQIDNYDPGIGDFTSLGDSADTVLDNPTILYIGKNDTLAEGKGFEGCIYRMELDNIYPLKRAFQDPRPDYISLTPEGKIREDMCGFEEMTQPADPIETRPPDPSLVNVTYPVAKPRDMHHYERVIVGIIAVLVLLVLLVVLYVVFNYCCKKGDYETKEAKGADLADNPDMAIMYNQEGLPIPKRKEWFV